MLRYFNHLGRYEGETPHDILLALHAEARKGWDCTLAEWKQWNCDLWKERVPEDFTITDDPASEARFLDGLVKAGVVEREKEV